MNGDTTVMTFAVAIYIGSALSQFFGSITRDLITPVIAGIFPGVQQSIDKIVITIGTVKLNIGDVIASTINLLIAYFVVSMTLPFIRSYVPLGGKR